MEEKTEKKKKQIVFLEPYPEVMVYKIAKIFKQKGYETISIRLLESKGQSTGFYTDAFDKIISFNLAFFKLNFKNAFPIFISAVTNLKNIFKATIQNLKLNPYVIICRGGPSWPCALTRILFKKIPLVYFPYDIRSQVESTKVLKERGTPGFDIKAERFSFENSDGIMYKGAPEEINFLEGDALGYDIKLPSATLNLLPYCSKDFIIPLNENKLSKKDNKKAEEKQIHIVNVDSVGKVGLMSMAYVYDDFLQIIRNRIHIHTYSRPNVSTWEEFLAMFNEDSEFTRKYKEVINSPYFHLHPPLDPKELIPEISKYDWGLAPSGFVSKNKKEQTDLKFSTGNKIAAYLEAGIPVLSEAKQEFQNSLITENRTGLVYDLENIKYIRKILEKADYKKFEKNILKYRKGKYSMEKNFPRLLKFIEKAVNNRKAANKGRAR